MSATTKQTNISVISESADLELATQQLAEKLNLPYSKMNKPPPSTLFTLCQTQQRLELRWNEAKGPGPLYIDFTEGKLGYRQRHAVGRNEAIAKAVGIKKAYRPTILDLTAGLGRDAYILATLGCKVEMQERSPIIYQLLRDGIARLGQQPEFREIADHMLLTEEDSLTTPQQAEKRKEVDVVYIDPMYPHQNKTALVKKEMRYLRAIVGDDLDAATLLNTARSLAKKRIVVKRPRLAPFLDHTHPSFSLNGKNTRFDIYIP